VEGHGGNLEGEADEEKHEAENNAKVRVALHRRRNAGEGDGPREAVDQRGAIKQHAGRQSAEDEILQPGFRSPDVIAMKRGDHVKRQAHQFKAEIERNEVGRRNQDHHAERRHHDQDRKLEGRDPLPPHEFHR